MKWFTYIISDLAELINQIFFPRVDFEYEISDHTVITNDGRNVRTTKVEKLHISKCVKNKTADNNSQHIQQ